MRQPNLNLCGVIRTIATSQGDVRAEFKKSRALTSSSWSIASRRTKSAILPEWSSCRTSSWQRIRMIVSRTWRTAKDSTKRSAAGRTQCAMAEFCLNTRSAKSRSYKKTRATARTYVGVLLVTGTITPEEEKAALSDLHRLTQSLWRQTRRAQKKRERNWNAACSQ